MVQEWFRSPLWDETAREDFEARLKRARVTSRQQYLLLKAWSLKGAGHLDAARELFERSAAFEPGSWPQRSQAWEPLADLAAERGDRAEAERLLRRILQQPSESSTSGMVRVKLAGLLLDHGGSVEREEAVAQLTAWTGTTGTKLTSMWFDWHLMLIRAAEAGGEHETVRDAAESALDLTQRGPQFRRHPTVGLVSANEATLNRLEKLARTGGASPVARARALLNRQPPPSRPGQAAFVGAETLPSAVTRASTASNPASAPTDDDRVVRALAPVLPIRKAWDLLSVPELSPAAVQVLLGLLPQLTHERTLEGVARGLGRKLPDRALADRVAVALVCAFRASSNASTRWAIGDSLHTLQAPSAGSDLVALLADPAGGNGRERIADALGLKKYRATSGADEALLAAVNDPDLVSHAATSLAKRGTPGAVDALRATTACQTKWQQDTVNKAIDKLSS